MAENENEDGVEVSDLTPEELEAVGDTDTSTDTGEVPEGDAADGGGDMAVDEDMLADMLDQALMHLKVMTAWLLMTICWLIC
jgi:hypothetical protein